MTFLSTHSTLPSATSAEEFVRALQNEPALRDHPDAWLSAYLPDQARFDTREMRRRPLEWNASNHFDRDNSEKPVWVLRFRTQDDWERGLVVYPGGEARWTQERNDLGFPPHSGQPD
jgi:hypothetical protein